MSIIAMSVYITGCEKDADRVFHDSVLENRYDSTTSTSNSLLENVNFDQDGNILIGNYPNQIVLQHAGIEYQREMSNYIIENQNSNYISLLKTEYGVPNWELCTIEFAVDNPDLYIITLPLIKENNLTSILIYANYFGEKKIAFLSKEKYLETLSQLRENSDFFIKWSYRISRYSLVEYFINGKINKKYITWANVAKNIIEGTVNSRCEHYYFVTWWEHSDGSISGVTATYLYSICAPYFEGGSDFTGDGEQPGGGNPNGKKGNNNPSTNPTDPNNPKNKKIKNNDEEDETKKDAECTKKVLDFMARDDVKQMIKNNSLTDPCNPDKSTKDIIDDALSGKCKDGVLNLGTVKDFLKDLGDSGDYIEFDPSFDNCPRAKCVFDKLKNKGSKDICKIIHNLDISSNIFKLKIGNTDPDSGYTTYNPKTGITTVTLSDSYCNNDEPYQDYLIARTLTHELIHAKINLILLNAGYNPNEFKGYEQLYKHYANYLEWFYEHEGVNDVHHAIMLKIENDITIIAKTLFNLFGSEGQTYIDFMCGASNGLLEIVSEHEKNLFYNKYCKNNEGYGKYSLNCN